MLYLATKNNKNGTKANASMGQKPYFFAVELQCTSIFDYLR